MKIDINEDFEAVFQNEIFAGFTSRQCICAGIGLLAGLGTMVALWHYTGMPVVQCSYVMVPVMVPFCAVGFFTYQGQSPLQLLKAIWYVRQTARLTYQAAERQETMGRVFTMKRTLPKKQKRRKDDVHI